MATTTQQVMGEQVPEPRVAGPGGHWARVRMFLIPLSPPTHSRCGSANGVRRRRAIDDAVLHAAAIHVDRVTEDQQGEED
jgi:hypothetical protein